MKYMYYHLYFRDVFSLYTAENVSLHDNVPQNRSDQYIVYESNHVIENLKFTFIQMFYAAFLFPISTNMTSQCWNANNLNVSINQSATPWQEHEWKW